MLFFSSPIKEFLGHTDVFDLTYLSRYGMFRDLVVNQVDECENEKYSMSYIRHVWFLQHLCFYDEIMLSFCDSINEATLLQSFVEVIGIDMIKEQYRKPLRDGLDKALCPKSEQVAREERDEKVGSSHKSVGLRHYRRFGRQYGALHGIGVEELGRVISGFLANQSMFGGSRLMIRVKHHEELVQKLSQLLEPYLFSAAQIDRVCAKIHDVLSIEKIELSGWLLCRQRIARLTIDEAAFVGFLQEIHSMKYANQWYSP